MARRFQIFLQLTVLSLLTVLVWAPPGMAQAVPAADSCLERIVPVQLAPREKATLEGPEVLFQWSAGLNVSKYKLHIYYEYGPEVAVYAPVSELSQEVTLESGQAYRWEVEGISSQENCGSVRSESFWFSVSNQVIPPSRAGDVSASKGTVLNRVKISWSDSPRADYFKVSRSELNGSGLTLVSPASGNEIYDDYGTLGHQYKYFVEACNAGGCVFMQEHDVGWTGSCQAEIPIVTLISPKNGEHFIVDPGDWPFIGLNWSEIPGVVLYEIEGVTEDSSSVFEDVANHLYHYSQGEVKWRVRAYDPAEGCQPGPWSERWSFTIENMVTPTPINLRATRGKYPDMVVLSWEMPEGSEERSKRIDIFRHMVGGSETVNIATIENEVQTYNDTNVIPGKVYVYWVIAEMGMWNPSPFSQSDIGYAGTETDPPLPGIFLPMIGG